MTWSETHRRWQALQEIEALVNASDSSELPWNDEYAAIFGTPERLLEVLRYRWELSRSAQLDTHLGEEALERQARVLARRNAGVLRVLRVHGTASAEDRDGQAPPVPRQRVGGTTAASSGSPEAARVPA